MALGRAARSGNVDYSRCAGRNHAPPSDAQSRRGRWTVSDGPTARGPLTGQRPVRRGGAQVTARRCRGPAAKPPEAQPRCGRQISRNTRSTLRGV